MAKNAKEIKEQESKLLTYLRDDTKLDKDTKMQYISMANMFLDNFDKYLHLTSIEMNKEIPLGIDTWKDFLNYPKGLYSLIERS